MYLVPLVMGCICPKLTVGLELILDCLSDSEMCLLCIGGVRETNIASTQYRIRSVAQVKWTY